MAAVGMGLRAAPAAVDWQTALAGVGSIAIVVLVVLLWRRLADWRSAAGQYRTLFEANPFPMWIYDRGNYRFLAVNDAACVKYGYSRAEFLTKTILDIRPEEDRAALVRSIEQDGPVHGPVWRHLTQDGRLLQVEISSHELRWQGRKAQMTMVRDVTEQLRAQEALRRSEEQLRSVLESTGEGIYSVDLNNECQWANPAAAQLLGCTKPEELLGRNMHALAHHTRADGTAYPNEECAMMLAAKEGRGILVEDEILWRADGTPFHAEYRSSPIRREGAIVGAVVSFINIEPRLRAEEARRRSEERLRSLSQSGIVGLSVGSHDGRILEANDAYLRMLGYTREDLEAGAIRWDSFTAAEYRDLSREAHRKLLAGQSVPPWRSELVRKDGTRVPVLIALAPLDGGAISILLDLTQLRQTELSLQASEERYRQLFERNLAGVFSLDGKGRVLEANAAFARIAGQGSREEMIGADAHALFDDLEGLVQELRLRGAVTNRELRIRDAEGNAVPVLANISYLMGGTELPDRIEGTVIDVTEYKKLELQFLQAQKMESVGQLAGGIAHDFNNLLTVINGYCEMLLARAREEEQRHRLELILKAGTRAATLTRQLLAFSRKQVFELRVLDLNQVIHDCTSLLQRLVGENLEVKPVLAEDLHAVHADPNQMEQVLMNLVVNARDAMPDGGKITIETHNVSLDEAYARSHPEVKPGEYVLLAVTDTGTGMDEATKAHIFEPFFTTKPVGEGTGLGLATVFGIVKQSGGTVSVYSEPGKGTSMKVYLPAHRAAAEAAAEAAAPMLLTGTETVLLVEDDEAVREFASDVLRGCGYRVLAAAGVDEAFAQSARHPGAIHLLVTDVIMPHMVGTALAERLRRGRPGMRVLYVSGYPSHAVVASGALLEEAAFLQKPYSSQSLAARVRSVLDAPEWETAQAAGVD